MQQVQNRFDNDKNTGYDDQGAFYRCRDKLRFAVAIRVGFITGFCGYIQAVPANETRRYVYNTFKRIGKDGNGFGKKISGKLNSQQEYAQQRYPFLNGERFDGESLMVNN